MAHPQEPASSAVLTVPNAISFARILLIPIFVALLLNDGTERAGLLLFAVVAASDWVDGYVARRTGQVSELGKLLDPTADRLAIGAGLIALAVAGAVPWWAVLLVIVRDLLVLAAGIALLAVRGARIDVRFLGKVATFTLMVSIVLLAYGHFGIPPASLSRALGWIGYGIGLAESYVATVFYASDLRDAWRSPQASKRRSGEPEARGYDEPRGDA
ncbi:MAG: CDP-alcohol phosphatidyltransferase family protein [Actinomycetota bacterium]